MKNKIIFILLVFISCFMFSSCLMHYIYSNMFKMEDDVLSLLEESKIIVKNEKDETLIEKNSPCRTDHSSLGAVVVKSSLLEGENYTVTVFIKLNKGYIQKEYAESFFIDFINIEYTDGTEQEVENVQCIQGDDYCYFERTFEKNVKQIDGSLWVCDKNDEKIIGSHFVLLIGDEYYLRDE